ncbi:MAG: c-type cytochrome [Opitutales bacterium]
MRRVIPLLIASVLSASLGAQTKVIEAFEGDGFDSWQTTGTGFGLAPIAGKVDGVNGEFRNYAGNALVCSGHRGDAATGTLTSPEIKLTHSYVGFLVAGGNHPGKTAVQLLVGGKVVRESTGANDLTLREKVWDVSEFKGKTGVIRIVDEHVGSWGIIAADHFLFSTDAKPKFPSGGRPKPKADSNLVRVAGEGSAALVPGASFKVSGDRKVTGVTSPTAIAFGNDGSVYVAESHRFRFGVEDDRNHLYWYHDDLAAATTADRLALHKKWEAKRSHEWMTAKSELIRHVGGEQADGTFTTNKVFAGRFNDVLDGTGAGVMAWDDTVYFACIPKLWMLQDAKRDGVEAQRKVIEDGFGVRISLSGHDMNGFAIGPDGRVWGTIGDRGFNVTTKEGRKYDSRNRGAVFRFEPDGTDFEVVHFGLRNPKEIAFDDFGNGFSVDNNSDQGDAARVVYVVEGADSGWEMEHQAMHTFHRSIGLEQRPLSRWMTEKVWELQNPVQPAFIIPPSAYISSGPSGLTYHPGAGFLESEAGHFHICDYRGSAGASGIWSFKMEPAGAGMKMTSSHQLLWGVAATDVEYDWKGRLVVSDFITGWESHEAGRLVTLEANKMMKPEAVAPVAALINGGIDKASSAELAALLAHADQRVRLRAQIELTRRPDAADRFEAATRSANALERVHGVWGLGILARRGAAVAPGSAWKGPTPVASVEERSAAARRLVPLLDHADAEVRAQAVRALSEAPLKGDDLPLGKLILDPSLRVRSFAALAAARLGAEKHLPEVLAMLKQNADADPVLRHAGSYAIDRLCKTPEALDAVAKDDNASVRLAVVITLRRRLDPSAARFVKDKSTIVADEAIRAVHDLGLEAGRPAVAALIDDLGSREWTTFMLRRLTHSAFRLGGEKNAGRVVAIAANEKLPAEARAEALRLLALWTNPHPVDQSTGHWAPLPARDAQELRASLSAALPTLLKGDSDILRASLELVEQYKLEVASLSDDLLAGLVANEKLSGSARAKALELWLERKPAALAAVAGKYAKDKQDEVAMVALGALAHLNPQLGLAELSKSVADGSAARRQGAWKALAKLPAPGVDALFVANLKALAQAKGVSPAAVELLEAAAQRAEPSVKEALAAAQKAIAGGDDKLAKWMPALEGGDAKNGFALFTALPAGQCLRCHRASDDSHAAGGEAGPNLAGIAKRGDRRYLLESVVNAGAVVAAGYGTVNLDLANGSALVGTLIKEEKDHVDVDVTGNRWRVARKDIKAMSAPVSGMPAMDALTLKEVRDIVAWLATLDKAPKKAKAVEPKPLDIATIKPVATAAASNVDPAVMALGKQQFATCMACHGPNAEGTAIAPPLAKSDWVNGPVENLIRIQLRGLTGPLKVSGKDYVLPVPMPPQAHQTDEQIAAVLTYVRNSFGNSAPAVKPEQVKALRGEAGKPMLTQADLVPPGR